MNAQALDRVLGQIRPGATVTETRRLARGNHKHTTVVRFAETDPIVIQSPSDRAGIETEALLLGAIAEQTSIPVPAPLATGGESGGWLVTPLVSGADLHEQFTALSPADRRQIVAHLGHGLAELHERFEFDAYGPVSAVDGRLETTALDRTAVGGGIELGESSAVTTDWETWLTAVGEAAIARLPDEFDDLTPDLRSAIANQTVDSAATPRLFPWDFRPGNALVEDGKLTAVLDWEGPLAADPALSYAKAAYLVADWYLPEQKQTLRSAFRRGYESVREVPAVGSAHRVTAIASTAVDSQGVVTNPGYPPVDRGLAIDFHREALRRVL